MNSFCLGISSIGTNTTKARWLHSEIEAAYFLQPVRQYFSRRFRLSSFVARNRWSSTEAPWVQPFFSWHAWPHCHDCRQYSRPISRSCFFALFHLLWEPSNVFLAAGGLWLSCMGLPPFDAHTSLAAASSSEWLVNVDTVNVSVSTVANGANEHEMLGRSITPFQPYRMFWYKLLVLSLTL